MGKYLTTKQTAELLGISYQTLINERKALESYLPYISIEKGKVNRLFYLEEDVMRVKNIKDNCVCVSVLAKELGVTLVILMKAVNLKGVEVKVYNLNKVRYIHRKDIVTVKANLKSLKTIKASRFNYLGKALPKATGIGLKVAQLKIKGFTNNEIAKKVGIKATCVSTHLYNLRKK